jgi:hypothetical protein
MNLRTWFLILTLGIAATDAVAKDTAASSLKKLLVSRIEAFSRSDTVELKNICTKNYQLINSAGMRMNIDEAFQYSRKQKNQIKSYVILSFQPFIAEDESMAFVISEIEEQVVQDTMLVKNSLLLTEIYRKVNKTWKIQLTQLSQKICNAP